MADEENDRLARARAALAAAEQSAAASGAGGGSATSGEVGGGSATTGEAGGGDDAGRPRRGGTRGRGGRRAAASGGEDPLDDAEPDPHDVARRIVLRQLTMAPRSRKQLEDKLRQRGCADDVAKTVLDRMTEVGLVDDEAYARSLARTRVETKGLAARAITHELRRKGVAEEHIEQALDDVDPDVEKEQARGLVAKRLRTMRGLEREVQTRRLAGFLARKGYSGGVAYEVIREALADLPEHQRD
ncbi:regulatory protein RecX [Ornithinicoccus hortensis]|uniref:regulatory protein RecX n=1 Tax=Ornithinicoccus hortensis TaxID=82346 RepID=UPI00115479D3|nr:regulatory protein RecX [Ornithinicoccus hortensis]